jgi:folate-binding protein YgfZ
MRSRIARNRAIALREPSMTELIAPPATHETPLTRFLASNSATPPKLIPYCGVLTPHQLDAPEAETEALLSGAAIHDLGWIRRIAVRGEDRVRWLSGMVTNEVEALPDRRGAYNLILNAQGRIQGDAVVWHDGDALELELTAAQSDALLAHLDHFIIMDDVELAPVTGQSALGLTGPRAEEILSKVGLSALPDLLSTTQGSVEGIPVRLDRGYGALVPHYAIWADDEQIPALWKELVGAGASPVGAASLETLRIIEGIPAYGIDIQSRDLAQETSQTRALSFSKGCYLGQEIVERIRSRGQVHRHLRALELFPQSNDLPSAGTELRLANGGPDAKAAGNLTSITELQQNGDRRIFAIAMIRAEAEISSQPLAYEGGTAQILSSTPKGI